MQRAPPAPRPSALAVSSDGEQLALEGSLVIGTLGKLRDFLRPWQGRPRPLDLGKVSDLDTPGALALCRLRQQGFELAAIRAEHQALLDLVAVSVLREMGVLITAIMVAGRSGSAFTAEIGMMKAREEIDALKAMGMDPMEVLVVPRLIGLVATLPLLTFYADIMGLLGGAAITRSLLHVSLLQYVERVHQAVDTSDLFVGLVKAPVFAFFIASIGCMHGLRGKGSAESVGRATTRAVVKAIFLVIVLDALFSVLFQKLGL